MSGFGAKMSNSLNSNNSLKSSAEAKYKELIEFLQSPSLSDKVDFVIAPVQPVGRW
jgi:hypothetical protein